MGQKVKNNEDMLSCKPEQLLYLNVLVNRDIVTSKGEKVGKVTNFLFSSKKGRVEFLIIKEKTSLFAGKKETMIPYKKVEYQGAHLPLILHAEKENLQSNTPQVKREEICVNHYDLVSEFWDCAKKSDREN